MRDVIRRSGYVRQTLTNFLGKYIFLKNILKLSLKKILSVVDDESSAKWFDRYFISFIINMTTDKISAYSKMLFKFKYLKFHIIFKNVKWTTVYAKRNIMLGKYKNIYQKHVVSKKDDWSIMKSQL